MECEICQQDKDEDESADDGAKFCGHKPECDCEEPEPPSGLPDCEGGEPTDPTGCNPSLEIARRQREIAAAEADVAHRNEALDALKAKSDLLAEALAAHEEDAANREERRKACKEFVDCKRPKLRPEDRECVEGAIDDYHDLLDSYEHYIMYVIWKLGRASAKTARLEHALKRAEDHFDWVRSQATDCLKDCGTLKELFEQAVEDDDRCAMYLYWLLAYRHLDDSNSGCGTKEDYQDHLCRARCATEGDTRPCLHGRSLATQVVAGHMGVHERDRPRLWESPVMLRKCPNVGDQRL